MYRYEYIYYYVDVTDVHSIRYEIHSSRTMHFQCRFRSIGVNVQTGAHEVSVGL